MAAQPVIVGAVVKGVSVPVSLVAPFCVVVTVGLAPVFVIVLASDLVVDVGGLDGEAVVVDRCAPAWMVMLLLRMKSMPSRTWKSVGPMLRSVKQMKLCLMARPSTVTVTS